MPSFLESLWDSVFQPGPTPSLLVAANATFAALQVVLLALLLATKSLHFIVLSILCAGLWASINWFAAELKRSQEAEEALRNRGEEMEAQRERIAKRGGMVPEAGDSSETETEEATPAPEDRRVSGHGSVGVAGTSARQRADDQEARRRPVRSSGMSESEGSVSTDSEWEKVEQ